MTGQTTERKGFTRRGCLVGIGIVAAGTVGATQTASASTSGYGVGGYGAGGYGGEADGDDDVSEGTPEIERLSGEDTSNPRNPHVEATIEWAASIEESELYAAILILSDPNGDIKRWKYDLSGQTVERTEEKRIPHGASGDNEDLTYTLELTVYSYYGNTDYETTTFESQ